MFCFVLCFLHEREFDYIFTSPLGARLIIFTFTNFNIMRFVSSSRSLSSRVPLFFFYDRQQRDDDVIYVIHFYWISPLFPKVVYIDEILG